MFPSGGTQRALRTLLSGSVCPMNGFIEALIYFVTRIDLAQQISSTFPTRDRHQGYSSSTTVTQTSGKDDGNDKMGASPPNSVVDPPVVVPDNVRPLTQYTACVNAGVDDAHKATIPSSLYKDPDDVFPASPPWGRREQKHSNPAPRQRIGRGVVRGVGNDPVHGGRQHARRPREARRPSRLPRAPARTSFSCWTIKVTSAANRPRY